jgi:hypothetical protein
MVCDGRSPPRRAKCTLDRSESRRNSAVLKWLLTLLVALVMLTAISPWLGRRFGLGRLPGDLMVRVRGRDYYVPFTTTLLLSLALTALSRLL